MKCSLSLDALKFAVKLRSHLLLRCEISLVKYSNINRTLDIWEFSVQAKKFPLKILLMFNLVMQNFAEISLNVTHLKEA